MRSVLLQDTITIRGFGATPVIQSFADWLDVPGFADAIFWLEVKEVTNPSGGTVSLSFETAPDAQESMFSPIDTVTALAVTTSPLVRKVFLNATYGVPLARFLRWKLVGSNASGPWDATFRIYVTLGPGVRNAFSPLQLPGLLLWLRADQGIAAASNKVSLWSDLSGKGNHASQSVGTSQPTWVANAINGRPAIDFSAANTFLDTTAANLVPGGTPYSVMVVAKNGSGPLFTIRRNTTYSATKFQSTNTYVHGDGINPGSNVTVANTTAETQSALAGFKSCHRYYGAGLAPDIYLNGTKRPVTGGTQANEAGTLSGYVLGADGTPGEVWLGLIAEVIVTSGAITDAYRTRVEQYQRDFFGV